MDRCSGCEHYKRFVEEMEREEEKFWNRVDEISKDSTYQPRGGDSVGW